MKGSGKKQDNLLVRVQIDQFSVPRRWNEARHPS